MLDWYTYFELEGLSNRDKDRIVIFSLFIRLSKMGRIMGSPMAGGRVGGWRPLLCPEHISKTILATVMKFHGWIDLIKGECSAQES